MRQDWDVLLQVIPRCQCEGEEVVVERFGCGIVFIVPEKEITDDFARAANLAEARSAVFWITNGQIKKFECAVERPVQPLYVTLFFCFQCASDFTSDVSELLANRKRMPAARGEAWMNGDLGHGSKF